MVEGLSRSQNISPQARPTPNEAIRKTDAPLNEEQRAIIRRIGERSARFDVEAQLVLSHLAAVRQPAVCSS